MEGRNHISDLGSLETVVRVLDRAYGLNVAPFDETFLQKVIAKRVELVGLQSVSEYLNYLAQHSEEADEVSRSLRIVYSEFFRDALSFTILEQQILPSLIAEKEWSGQREVRVWSAGCAAGQEAWSIAMLLDELTEARAQSFGYRVFATDLSESDLALARAGTYSAEALGNVRMRQIRTFFSCHGDAYTVVPRLRAQVDFSSYDLLSEGSSSPSASIYGDFDLIFCCNLLFYYRSDVRQQILGKILRALVPGGYVVTGSAEREIVAKQKGLRAVTSAPIFKKRGNA